MCSMQAAGIVDAGGFYVFVLMSGEPLELRAFWAGLD